MANKMKIRTLGIIGLLVFIPGSNNSLNHKEEKPLTLSDFNINYTQRVINKLISLYGRRIKELPICQLGVRRGNNFYVNNIRIPRRYTSTDTTTIYNGEDCNSHSYLGMIHNHTNQNTP